MQSSVAYNPYNQPHEWERRDGPEGHRPDSRAGFEIALICALRLEYDAVCLLVDAFWDENGDVFGRSRGDNNHYTTGRIGTHNVVIVLLPGMGKVNAAGAASGLRSTYPNIKLAILVGICGGVPVEWHNGDEILLGDVIISETLVQFDMGRRYPHGFQTRADSHSALRGPGKDVLNLVSLLKTNLGQDRLQQRTSFFLRKIQNAATQQNRNYYGYPGAGQDKLFISDYRHQHRGDVSCMCSQGDSPDGIVCQNALNSSCAETLCDESHLLARARLDMRISLESQGHDIGVQDPAIFFGGIASGDTVMKSGRDRDRIAQELKVLAFEMEGSGLWEELPSIVVKAVCDYSDSHKNKKWQNFAAATAAAATRAVLESYIKTDGQGRFLGNIFAPYSAQASTHSDARNTRPTGGQAEKNWRDSLLHQALQALPRTMQRSLTTASGSGPISTRWADTVLGYLKSQPEVPAELSNTMPYRRFQTGAERSIWYEVLGFPDDDLDEHRQRLSQEHETICLSILGSQLRKDEEIPRAAKSRAARPKTTDLPPSESLGESLQAFAQRTGVSVLDQNIDNPLAVRTVRRSRRLCLFYSASPYDFDDNYTSSFQSFLWSLATQILLWKPRFMSVFLGWLGIGTTSVQTIPEAERLRYFIKLLLELNGTPVVISICHGEWLSDDFHQQSRQFLSDLYDGSLAPNVQVHILATVAEAAKVPVFLNSHQTLNKNTEINECLSDMKFDNQFLRREEVAVADPGTNEWIWSHPTFISWAQKSSGILWIEGKAGSGKSVLAKTIRSKLGQTGHFGTPGVPLPPISDWFYSTRHDSIARSHLSFLRSILSQILEQNKSSFQQYASIYRQKKENQESWTIEDYEQVLTGLAEMGVPAVSIVDAMDESDDGDGDFELRSRVIALMATLCLEAKSQLRFVVTSRYTADINRSFRKLSQNEGLLAHIVIERENWRDIQTIVENGLSKVRTALELFESDDDEAMDVPISHFQQNSETEVLSRMRQYLVDNADGVILWVNLSTQALADRVRRGFYNLKKLESELESLPQDLFDFYRLSLSELEHRYSPEDLSKTRLALMWVVGTNSIRPLALEELYEALSIDFATTSLIPAGLDPIANNPLRIHAKSWLGFYRQLRLRCGPFLEILAPQTQGYTPSFPESTEIKPHFTVQLIHRTVKEFLHNPEVSSILSFSEQEAEEMVQQSMRSYLNLVLPSSETAYCPIPARPGQDLDGIVRSMSEYLDKKYLLNFVLINLPEEEVLSHLAILELSVHPSLIQQKDYWPWNDALEDIATRYLKFACENSLARTITIQLTIASILLLSWPTLLRYGPLAVALKKCSAQYSTSREQPDSTSSKSDPKQKEITEAIDMLISFSSREQNLEWDAFGVGERRGPRGPSVPDSHVLSDLIVAVELFQGKRMKKKVAPKRPADDAETRDRVHTVQSADPFRLLAPWPPPTDEELTAMSQFLADDDDSAATPRIIYGTGLLGLDLDLYSGSTQTPDLLCEDTIMEDAPP